jgi:hypothetical protein
MGLLAFNSAMALGFKVDEPTCWGGASPPRCRSLAADTNSKGSRTDVGPKKSTEHRGEDLIVQLVLLAASVDAGLDRGGDVTADRLPVDPGQTLDRSQPFAPDPQPEHLSRLEHEHLPESHRRSSDRFSDGGEWIGSATRRGGRPRGAPITDGKVIPCSWGNSVQGGSMLVAGDTRREAGQRGEPESWSTTKGNSAGTQGWREDKEW